MFSDLAGRLQETLRRLRGKGKLTEKDVEEALREVRVALLEADVHFKVVKDFIAKVKERAVGQDVLHSLSPSHQVIKIVNEELTALMGGTASGLQFASRLPAPVMMVGLQGAGKTTCTAKLASYLKRRGHRPLLAACDVTRPAAVKQLQVLGEQVGVPVFAAAAGLSPVEIAKASMEAARTKGHDVLLIDTAGRLHVDEPLMEELEIIKAEVRPVELLFVADAMTGQDAVNVAKTFDERLDLTGVILTKLDGDARGGAALSIKAITGKPVKYVGLGEKMDALEPFHPDRMASRILGMGDVLSLIEKAQATFDAEKAQVMAEKLRSAEFTLEDFLEQLQQVRNMGPIDQILGMIPGLAGNPRLKGLQVDERELSHVEAIIRSMTPKERRHPNVIDGSRRKRIAAGSGTQVQDVNRLLKQYDQARMMMRQLGKLQKNPKKRGLLERFRG